jgi:hypothetical protein
VGKRETQGLHRRLRRRWEDKNEIVLK